MCADCKRSFSLQRLSYGYIRSGTMGTEYWSFGENTHDSPPNGTQHASGYGSTDCVMPRIPRPLAHHGSDYDIGKHKDPVPGMRYYQKACKILDEYIDGHELLHAQGFSARRIVLWPASLCREEHGLVIAELEE